MEAAGEITLQYVAVNSVQRLGDVLRSKCGTSKDFWFGTIACSQHQDLANKLPGLHVGPFWAAETFTHCYASLSSDPDADFADFSQRFGLGQRTKKPGRKCSGAGMVYLLLNLNGFSKLYKYHMELAAAPKEKKAKSDAPKGAAGKRSRDSRSTKQIDAEVILDDATLPQTKKSRTFVVDDPLAREWPSHKTGGGSSAPSKPLQASHDHHSHHDHHGHHGHGKQDLHRRQVAVIQRRLEEMLPNLPLEQLSTSLALTKLEEAMQKRKGKFDEFRADVERIIIAYVTKRSAAAKVAARRAKHGHEVAPEAAPDAAPAASEEAAASSKPGDDAHSETQETTTAANGLPIEETQASQEPQEDGTPPRSPKASPVQIDEDDEPEAEVREASCGEDLVEVDRWGFQVALSQLRECTGRPPSDALAVLTALLAARPSEDLLSFGPWEASLGAHERMTSNRRVARMCKRLRERWQALDRAKREQSLYAKALTAIDQLKTLYTNSVAESRVAGEGKHYSGGSASM